MSIKNKCRIEWHDFFPANSFLNPNRSFCCDTFLCLNSFQIFSHSSTSCFFVSRRKCFETLKNFSFAAAFQKKVSTWNWKLKACFHYVLLIEKNCLFSLACSVSVCNTKPASARSKMQRTKLHLKTAMGQNVLQHWHLPYLHILFSDIQRKRSMGSTSKNAKQIRGIWE